MVQLQYSGILGCFKGLQDPRARPNRIYAWQLLWALISAAMVSACPPPTASARWLKEHRDDLIQERVAQAR